VRGASTTVAPRIALRLRAPGAPLVAAAAERPLSPAWSQSSVAVKPRPLGIASVTITASSPSPGSRLRMRRSSVTSHAT
jgi:hypothetical protein